MGAMNIMNRVINNAQELEQILVTNRIVIYGAGYVAERFYMILKEKGLHENVECFVTTTGSEKTVCDLPIKSVEQLKKGAFICVAVHEAIKNDVFEVLKMKNQSNYIWIYPYIYELLLGEPIKRQVNVSVKEILEKENQYYGLTIRYLAVEQYFGNNQEGYDIYKKAWSLICNYDTACARLDKFKILIKTLEKTGYDEQKPIKILENGEIIDGIHRLAYAVYKNSESIVCDIYANVGDNIKVHSENIRMTQATINEEKFTQEEIELVKMTKQHINEQYLIQ